MIYIKTILCLLSGFIPYFTVLIYKASWITDFWSWEDGAVRIIFVILSLFCVAFSITGLTLK